MGMHFIKVTVLSCRMFSDCSLCHRWVQTVQPHVYHSSHSVDWCPAGIKGLTADREQKTGSRVEKRKEDRVKSRQNIGRQN